MWSLVKLEMNCSELLALALMRMPMDTGMRKPRAPGTELKKNSELRRHAARDRSSDSHFKHLEGDPSRCVQGSGLLGRIVCRAG